MLKPQKKTQQNWLEQRARLTAISQLIDIPKFAEEILKLQRIQPPTGGWLRASCPFTENHKNGDVNRSFGLAMDGSGRAKCFVCGSWDIAGLLMKLWKKSFDDVMAWLMEYVALDVTKITEMWTYPKTYQRKDFLFDDARLRATQNRIARYMLHERHVSAFTYKKYRLGYHNKTVYFPLYDFQENLIGLFTRPIDKKSYIFEDGTPRSEWLYGLERSREGEMCYIVESPIDCLRLASMGYNAVASMGASFSRTQAELAIDRFTAVCYIRDGDDAGKMGRVQAYEAIDHRIPFYTTKIWKHRKDIGECTVEEILKLLKTQYLFLHKKEKRNAFTKKQS